MKKYYICRNTFDASKLDTFEPINSILEWDIFAVDQKYATAIPGYAVEIPEDVATVGMRSWGDVRSTIRISSSAAEEESEFDGLSYEDTQGNAKMSIPMSEKRYKTVVKAMKLVAKIIIENVFNDRFKGLDDGVSELEKTNWKYLLEDVENDTNFILSELASAKNITPEKLKVDVIAKRDQYRLATKDLFVKMNAIKSEFYRCTTIRQLNRIYEDRMGIPMPFEQSRDENRSEEIVVPGLKF